jgi:hypothetical protein
MNELHRNALNQAEYDSRLLQKLQPKAELDAAVATFDRACRLSSLYLPALAQAATAKPRRRS